MCKKDWAASQNQRPRAKHRYKLGCIGFCHNILKSAIIYQPQYIFGQAVYILSWTKSLKQIQKCTHMKGVRFKWILSMFAMSLPALRRIFNPHLQNVKLISWVLIKYTYDQESNYGCWRVNEGVCGHVTLQGRFSVVFVILNEGG